MDASEEVTVVMAKDGRMKEKRKKRGRDGTVMLARVATPDSHATRIHDCRKYTELRLDGKKMKLVSRPGAVEGDDIFARDDLGRFLSRAKNTLSLDKYLEKFYASNLAKKYAHAGESGGIAIDSHSPPTTPRTPSPTSTKPTYANGVKAWRGRTRDKAEIECAVILDFVTRVKRLPPCVPRVLGHETRRSLDGRDIEYSLELEHVENLTRADLDPNGRHTDPTLAAYVEGGDSERDPEGFKRRLDGIFVQILLALSGLQRHCGFVHNDLHTKNVLLKAREGTGPLVVHDAASGRSHIFDDDVPLVKLIDFGDAMVRHPETGRVVSTRWTGHVQGFTNGADVRRLAIVLARHANGRGPTLFSSDLIADLVSIVDPNDGDVSALDGIVASANENSNVERFGFPLTGFATPSTLLETGRVARRFVDDRQTRVVPRNIFHELPDDGWASTRPFAWFSRRERGGSIAATRRDDLYAPCRPLLSVTPPELVELRDHALKALVKRLNNDPNFETQPDKLDFEAIAAYGSSADTRTRRRVAWTGLVLFQRAVVFYLRTFVSLEVTERVDFRGDADEADEADDEATGADVGLGELERLVARSVNELLGIVDDTVGTTNVTSDEERRRKKKEATRLVLRLCLVAACGGHGQFFAVASVGRRWWDAVAKITEAYDAAYDAGKIVAPAETIVRNVEEVETRAYADETRRDAAGPTVRRLFEWSGDCASAYSFDKKTLEDLVATN